MEKSEKFALVKSLIVSYENEEIGYDELYQKLTEVIELKEDKQEFLHSVHTYYGATDLDMFVKCLTIESIKDWHLIDDKKAMELLIAIKNNICEDDIILRNSSALEKRFRKPSGTISDFIFYNDLTAEQILEKLKIDDVTYL